MNDLLHTLIELRQNRAGEYRDAVLRDDDEHATNCLVEMQALDIVAPLLLGADDFAVYWRQRAEVR